MKARVKLALQQADMRSRLTRDNSRPTARTADLKRRIAATILAYERGWTPAKIASFFEWPIGDVERWFEAGKPLL
jgi:hypothetical protein